MEISKTFSEALKEYERKTKMPIWDIVRYVKGIFDCIYESGLTQKEAVKKCDELNNDYHSNYGFYMVVLHGHEKWNINYTGTTNTTKH